MAEASCQQSLAKVGRLRRELQEGEPQLQVAEEELEALGPPGKTSVPRCMMHRCGYCGVRVGEAAHPGPTSAGSMDADSRPTRARPGFCTMSSHVDLHGVDLQDAFREEPPVCHYNFGHQDQGHSQSLSLMPHDELHVPDIS